MTKIADLLDRNFSKPVKEVVSVNNDDPETVFAELSEYVVTDHIRAEFEALFSAIAASVKSLNSRVAVWISGFFGAGKSSFAKNLAYVLANREVLGVRASSLFVKQVESTLVNDCVEFLNRMVSFEVFTLDMHAHLLAQANAGQIAQAMYGQAHPDLGSAEDCSISDPEVAFNKLFDVCEIHSPGKTFAFIFDEMGQHLGFDSERRRNLRLLVEQFGKVSLDRVKAGKIPGPAWLIFTAEEKLHESLQDCFPYRIDLSCANIGEIAARRVLRKKDSQKLLLKKLFRDHGASLIRNVKLERCSRRTDFNEDHFVQFYPCFPHLIELYIDIVAGIRVHPNAPKHIPGGSRTMVKLCSDLLTSDRTRFADQPVGALVSIDTIYELLEVNIPPERQHEVSAISEHCDHKDHPGMAARVVKAICLMEFARKDLPRTTNNIAALLVRDITEAPPTAAVAAILDRMREAYVVHETTEGWKLHEYDFDELHRETAALDGFRRAVGTVNPRPPGWRNSLIQVAKKSLGRALAWHTRHLHAFNSVVTRSLEDIVAALNPLVDLPTDCIVLQRRLAQSEKKLATLQQQLEFLHDQVRTLRQGADVEAPAGNRARENCPFYLDERPACDRTAYVIGLFGTGRLYICELIRENIGERGRYFHDAIRMHLGPTPMIYSGHATIRHVSRGQNPPAVTSRILEAVKAGFADFIFIYRHPLDSLLTNWVWWRTHIRDSSRPSGIAEIYRNTEDLCCDLDQNFLEFKTFADGDPRFFARAEPGPSFLSFSEFVEETELYLQSDATLTLRLEDFMIDPLKQFSRIAEVMSVNVDLSALRVVPPKSKPYRYMAVSEKVSGFRRFIDGLNPVTKGRIERIGYHLTM